MNKQTPYHSWLNNPERRVGRVQLLRAMAAGTGASHPSEGETQAQRGKQAADRPKKSRGH